MNTEQSRNTCQLNELSVGGEQALVTPEVLAAAGGSPAPTLNDAMYLLAKLRDEKYYPKGGYSSDICDEWKAILDSYYGEVRPCFCLPTLNRRHDAKHCVKSSNTQG